MEEDREWAGLRIENLGEPPVLSLQPSQAGGGVVTKVDARREP